MTRECDNCGGASLETRKVGEEVLCPACADSREARTEKKTMPRSNDPKSKRTRFLAAIVEYEQAIEQLDRLWGELDTGDGDGAWIAFDRIAPPGRRLQVRDIGRWRRDVAERFGLETVKHFTDGECDVDSGTLCCRTCGVDHGAPCSQCHGRGFHRPSCSVGEGPG